nr:NB-ARC domain-containing protein [Caldilineaceae bacterium]
QGYELLQQDAAVLDDESRHRFLTAVPIHRAVDEAYRAWQAQQDEVTNDQVTARLSSPKSRWQADKLNDAPGHPVILREPNGRGHPVTLPPLYDWGDMPAVDLFHGRSQERAELMRWLGQPGSRLVIIQGIGGVGKTSLAASVTWEIAAQFDFVIWRSLLNAPPLAEMMRDWLQLLGRHRLADLPEKQDDQMRLLLGSLRQQRGLLILDNLESVLQAGAQAGAPRPGYEGYAQLIQQIGSSNHHSCLLLTSREQPQVLVRLLGHTQTVRLLPLAGLDVAAGQELLQLHGLSASAVQATSLVERYSGNPLALQLVASTINDLFGGDVHSFQQEGALAFDNIRQVLDEQVVRLSHLEREILIWLAIEREVVTVPTLRNNLVQPGAPRLLVEALQALQKRSLLERSGEGFTLQNVVMEYATELLVEQVCREIAHFGGIEAWRSEDATGASPPLRLATHLAESLLNHHALLKAQAKESVRQSQLRMIVQPIADRLMRQLDRHGVETVLQRVLAALRAQSSEPVSAAGYAGGNLLNLLLTLGSDVAKYDFSYLSVWQANLRGVYAPGLNLSGANLAGSTFTYSFGSLLTFQFDANNQLLVAELQEEQLRIWRVADRVILSEWSTQGLNLHTLFLSPDCQLIAGVADDYVIHLFDCAAGRLLFTLAGHQSPIWRLRFSPEGRILASGDAAGYMCIWACQSGQLVHSLSIPDMSITALAIDPDGQRLASATVDGTIYLWSIADGALLHSWRGHAEEVAVLEFALGGTLLASGSHDATVRLWEAPAGRLLHVLQGHIRSSGGGDPFVYLWDLEHGTALHILSSHVSAVERLLISPDGRWIATVDLNTIVSLWDTLRGQRVDFYPIYRNTHTSL